MNIPGRYAALLLMAGVAVALAAGNGTLEKDLATTLRLLGLPCGEVTRAARTNDKEHVATCTNGIQYRMFVNPAGRVVAQKL